MYDILALNTVYFERHSKAFGEISSRLGLKSKGKETNKHLAGGKQRESLVVIPP
jgi:hypothetical protein